MDAISVKSLSKYFILPKRKKIFNGKEESQKKRGIIRAVDDISFTIEEGEVFGFLGPNGAGKTTTIRMLSGVLKPTNGNISIFGENIWKDPLKVKQIIGNVPEMANVYIELTGMQNLTLIGEIYGIPKKERINRAESLL
ncbi:MAG: ATP-binding cassette domain-containing protein, partial [Promethearchaeota archaeon]